MLINNYINSQRISIRLANTARKFIASPEPSTLLREEGFRDPRSSELGPPHPRAMMEPHECSAGVMVAHDDVDEAVNNATDPQLEAEAALESAKSQRELRMRFGSRTADCSNG